METKLTGMDWFAVHVLVPFLAVGFFVNTVVDRKQTDVIDNMASITLDTLYVKIVNVPAPEPDHNGRFSVSTDLSSKITHYAEKHGIDVSLAHGLVAVESSFNPYAVSPVGAKGLTQLMEPTAGEYLDVVTDSVLFDVDTNLDVGFNYLAYLLDRFDGDVYNALAAYNAGPTRISHMLESGRKPHRTYANKVLRAGE